MFVVEFKMGAKHYDASDVDQVINYALDLKNFHAGSQFVACGDGAAPQAAEVRQLASQVAPCCRLPPGARVGDREIIRLFTFYEFFAGGGMVRAALAGRWRCLFANDLDQTKAEVYSANWGNDVLKVDDVHDLEADDLPGRADLAWASFPCQDVSCAGNGLGLGDERGRLKTRSGTFWPFIGLMGELKDRRRAPKVIVIENVLGLLTTDSGAAFRSVASSLARLDYRFGAIVVDARWFVPQSRPRVFVVAISKDAVLPDGITSESPVVPWHSDAVVRSWKNLPPSVASKWIWFNPGVAPKLRKKLADVVSDRPRDARWHDAAETRRLISMMSDANRRKLRDAQATGQRMVASLFLRMRPEKSVNRQRAEISFDEISGCLRTPKGGGSRLRVLVVKGKRVKSRLLSTKEAAKLMGLRKSYKLPLQYDATFRVLGDGVVVPAVAFLRTTLLEPLVRASKKARHRRKMAAKARQYRFEFLDRQGEAARL